MGKPWADKDKTPWGDGDPDGEAVRGSLTEGEPGEETKKKPSSESGTSNMEDL